jgi:glycosyltransferase involved in cell wall biosynthesis
LFGTVVKGAFENMTQALIRVADIVMVPGIALATYARAVCGKAAPRVYIVPNGVSEHFLRPYDGNRVRERLGYEEEDLVVGYVGSIEFWLDMRTLIKALSKVYREGLRIRLMLVGGRLQTAYTEDVMRWIEQEGIKRITDWVSFVEHERIPEYVAAMDVGTIPFDVKNPTAYYAAPNKLWEYLSQGVDVVSTPIPEALAYKSLLHIVASEDGYVAVLKKVKMVKGTVNTRKRRQDESMEHLKGRTWRASAEKTREIICSLVHDK